MGSNQDGNNSLAGLGRIVYDNGDKYVGGFVNNKKDGQGVHIGSNGSKYVGDFVNDARHGNGLYTTVNGNKYIGEFVNGSVNGTGAYWTTDGYRFFGDFVNGKMDGKIGYIAPDGNHMYLGDFSDNQKNGQGMIFFANGSKYIGDFVDDKMNGKIGYIAPDGDHLYIGDFSNNQKNGQGMILFADGSKYIGDFADGMITGHGTAIYPDGQIYIGEWKYGSRYGKGMMIQPDGSTQIGEWEDGELVSEKPKNDPPTTNTIDELNSLIGLNSVKQQIKRLKAVLLKNKDYKDTLNLHMCFYGNPGTGKTTVARLVARILYESGILPTDKLVETDRSGLVGEYVGQTGPKTHAKIQEAMGGVLFIDEAYSLSNSKMSANDYGKEAINILLKEMEDQRGKFCVILAGYKEPMEEMIATNPGFSSRINRKIDFEDYSLDEMATIFNNMIKEKHYTIEPDAMQELIYVFSDCSKMPDFANARTVRNILDSLIEIQALRLFEANNIDEDSNSTLIIDDIIQYRKDSNM